VTIDGRDQWIVAAHQNERRLRQRPQPRQAGPAAQRKQLIQIAKVARATHRGRMPADQGWVGAKGPAVDIRRCPAQVVLVGIAARRRHFPQHRGTCRHHCETGRRCGEHQPPAELWILMRELLRDSTAPGHAGDIDLRIAELRNKTGGKPRQPRRAIRQGRSGRTADTGHVKDDGRRTCECFEEGLCQLPVGSDSVEQQQRRLPAAAVPDGNLEQLSVDHDLPRFDLARRRDTVLCCRTVSQRRKSPEPQRGRDGVRCLATRVPQPLRLIVPAANRANQATSFPFVFRLRPRKRPDRMD
jgi:hypothetical protein